MVTWRFSMSWQIGFGSEWRGVLFWVLAFDRSSLRWDINSAAAWEPKPTFRVYDYNSCDTCTIHSHAHTNIHLHFFESPYSFCCCLWHLCCIYCSRGPSIPYLTPSPRTTRGQQNGLYTYLLPGTVPARYASRSPAGIRILSYKLFFPYYIQHSKLFFLSPLYQTYHTNRDKTVGGLSYRRCTAAAREKKKKKKEKGLFLPCAAKLTRTPLWSGFLVPHGHSSLTRIARSLPFSVD